MGGSAARSNVISGNDSWLEVAFEFDDMARPAFSPRELLCRRQRLQKQTYSFEFIFIRLNGFPDSALEVIGDPEGHDHGAFKFGTDLRRRQVVWGPGDVERCYPPQLNSWGLRPAACQVVAVALTWSGRDVKN